MKKLIALLLTLALAACLFVGCSDSDSSSATNTPAQPGSATNAPSQSGDDTGDTPDTPDAPANDGSLPLSDTLVEIDIWCPWGLAGASAYLQDYNSSLGFQLMERDTNVHVNWEIPTEGSENESFQLSIASQMYPDIYENFSQYYTRGIVDAVENEIVIQLDDVIDTYMPNYKGWISDPATNKKVATDEGYKALVYCIDKEAQLPWIGNAIRQDWLDRVGMSMPETYDELHDVLVAFRDQIEECEGPMMLDGANIGGDNFGNGMCGGFGTIGDFYAKDGTTIVYGPTEPAYLDYLRLMRDWYAEGLIDPDFTTRQLFTDGATYMFADKTGYCASMYLGNSEESGGRSADPDFYMVAAPAPVLNKGDVSHFGIISENVEMGAGITTQCEDIPLVARWIDFLYSDTGFIYQNYGEEGNTFFYDENGEPCLSSEGMEAFYGVPVGTCFQANGWISQAHLRDLWRGRAQRNMDIPANQTYIDAGAVWAKATADWVIPSFVTMTSEESSAYNAIYVDMNTYVDEISVRYILGLATDADLEEMQQTVQDMGVDTCIAMRQAALDRYNAR